MSINDDPFGQTQNAETPRYALSVRQPWAWAIIYAGKDIENRSAAAIQKGRMICKRIAIHASKGMTRDEYEDGRNYIADVLFRKGIGGSVPRPEELVRGALIGSVSVVGIVKQSDSLWWMGPRGLVLQDPCAWTHPHPCVGDLGYFDLEKERHHHRGLIDPPKPWMKAWPEGERAVRERKEKPLPLFGDAE